MPYKNKEDQLACRRRHYHRNKQEYFDRNTIVKQKRKAYIRGILGDSSCRTCKMDDARCLLFHHRDPKGKKWDVSRMACRSYRQIDEEIAKCDVLCRNCHAIVHDEMRVLGGHRAFNPEIVEGSNPSTRSTNQILGTLCAGDETTC